MIKSTAGVGGSFSDGEDPRRERYITFASDEIGPFCRIVGRCFFISKKSILTRGKR